ncbi:MAG: glutamine synthetase family protein [Alphaproteobacteria bacterium]
MTSGNTQLTDFIARHDITEVECLVADIAGTARGKILPDEKFLGSLGNKGLRLPETVFTQNVMGQNIDEDEVIDPADRDVYLRPDPNAIFLVPWYDEPTAQVICDAVYRSGDPVEFSSRAVLKRILKLYADKGLQPIVSPEVEFYLVEQNTDPDNRLRPPVGLSGRREAGSQSFGIDALNQFDPIVEDIYDFAEAMGLSADTMNHEYGPAQLEINFSHGDPLRLADEVFLFKRLVRQAAYRHNVYATFMAQPMEGAPGSGMHWHQSVVDTATGENVFANPDGTDTAALMSYIGGLQKYLPAAAAIYAPNVNSYRRITAADGYAVNTAWGVDNRNTGLRVPESNADSRRVEVRIMGADANPYLAIAISLACGLLGMEEDLRPDTPATGWEDIPDDHDLPRHLFSALDLLAECEPLQNILTPRFCKALEQVRRSEYEAYDKVVSRWEREFLLLNV